jgi:hypothetical protein
VCQPALHHCDKIAEKTALFWLLVLEISVCGGLAPLLLGLQQGRNTTVEDRGGGIMAPGSRATEGEERLWM